MEYAKPSIPRPLFERVDKVAKLEGFRSASDAITHWTRQGVEAAERKGVA